jgi:hypothetical protein
VHRSVLGGGPGRLEKPEEDPGPTTLARLPWRRRAGRVPALGSSRSGWRRGTAGPIRARELEPTHSDLNRGPAVYEVDRPKRCGMSVGMPSVAAQLAGLRFELTAPRGIAMDASSYAQTSVAPRRSDRRQSGQLPGLRRAEARLPAIYLNGHPRRVNSPPSQLIAHSVGLGDGCDG